MVLKETSNLIIIRRAGPFLGCAIILNHSHGHEFYDTLHSKKTPTDPWNIPEILNYLFMKEILSYLNFGVPGVCSRVLLELS